MIITHVEVEGFVPAKVLIDTGTEPVLLGQRVREALGLHGPKLEKCKITILTAAGTRESILGRKKVPIKIAFNIHRQGECHMYVKCLVTDTVNYNVCIGGGCNDKLALGVDPYREVAF